MKHIVLAILFAVFFIVGCKQTQATSAAADKQAAASTEKTAQAATKPAAEEQASATAVNTEALKRHIEDNSELRITRVEDTPVNGLYAVHLQSGDIVYSNARGDYFIAGDLYQVRGDRQGLENITEGHRSQQRVAKLEQINKADTITFAAKGKAKSHIYVFTDVDCYYCQKLHQEMAALNAGGLEVRYLGFPRAGIDSESYRKIQSAWCAKDKQEAMDKLKARQSIPTNLCSSKAVAEQFMLGQQLGVRGTPSIFTADGQLIAGYVPAQQLLQQLVQ